MTTPPVFVAVITTQPLVRAGLAALGVLHADRVTVLSDAEANSHPGRIDLFVYDATIEPLANADALGDLVGNRVVVLALSGQQREKATPHVLPWVEVLPLSLTLEGLTDAIELAARGIECSAHGPRQRHRDHIAATTHLSQRQVAILECIGSGWSNSEIAADQSIGVHTVKRETKRILGEIQAPHRIQAVLWAAQHGLASRPASPPVRRPCE